MNIETYLHKYRVFTHAELLYSLHRIYRIVTGECGVQRHEFIREVTTANNRNANNIDAWIKEVIICREINEKVNAANKKNSEADKSGYDNMSKTNEN